MEKVLNTRGLTDALKIADGTETLNGVGTAEDMEHIKAELEKY